MHAGAEVINSHRHVGGWVGSLVLIKWLLMHGYCVAHIVFSVVLPYQMQGSKTHTQYSFVCYDSSSVFSSVILSLFVLSPPANTPCDSYYHQWLCGALEGMLFNQWTYSPMLCTHL